MKFLKFSAAFTAAFSMAIGPLAQGAEAKKVAQAAAKPRVQVAQLNYDVDKQGVQDFLKYTGLGTKKRMTVGEFHSKMRPYYPKTLRNQMDEWARLNRNELMPEFQVGTYKDGEGKERVRLMLTKDKQTYTASYNPDSNGKFLKVNNVFLTRDDMKYFEQAISKLYHGDKGIQSVIAKTPAKNPRRPNLALSYDEFSRLKPAQRAEYMLRVRYVMEEAERVHAAYRGQQALNEKKHEFFVKMLLLEDAYAAAQRTCKNGAKLIKGVCPGEDRCIVNGYVAQYGTDGSCGGKGPGWEALKAQIDKYGGSGCSQKTEKDFISCNPLVYGYSDQGKPFCVKNAGASSAIYRASSDACPTASKLRKGTPDEQADKKRIIESYLAQSDPEKLKKLKEAGGLAFNEEGKVSKDQYDLIEKYLKELNEYVGDATTMCDTLPHSDIQKVRDEQRTACEGLRVRWMDIGYYPATPTGPVTSPGVDCSDPKWPIGSEAVGDKCECRKGEHKEAHPDMPDRQACMIDVIPVVGGNDDGKDEKKKDTCTSDQEAIPNAKEGEKQCKDKAGACTWCPWLIGGAVFAGVAGLIYFLTRNNGNNNKTTTDPDPCPPAPQICWPPGTNPPVTNPPTTQPPPPVQSPPPIPTPAVTPFVESTTGTSTSTSGGVR